MSNNVQYTLSLNDLLTDQLQRANETADRLEDTMNSLQGTISGVAGAIGIAFGIDQIKNFVVSVVDAGTKVEDATTGLTTLLKDSAAAAQVVQNTMKDAEIMPFGFESLLDANKALIAADVNAEEARETIKDLSNAIAATGGGDEQLSGMVVNLQQIKNVGKASADDIKQFANAGINIYKVLADATGKHIDQVKDMDVSYDLLTMSLHKAREAGGLYEHGIENMSNNTTVKISNIEDAIFSLKVKMYDDLRPAITAVLESVKDLMQWLTELWDWMVRNADTLKIVGEVALVAAGAFVVYKAAMMATALWAKINTTWQAIQYASIAVLGEGMLTASGFTIAMAAAQEWLNTAMRENPIGLIIAAIAALVAIIVVCWNKFEGFRAFMFAAWEVIKVVVGQIIEYFQALYNIIMGVFTLDTDQITKGLTQAEDVVFNSGKKIAEAAKAGWDAGIKDFAKDNPAGGGTVAAPVGVKPSGGDKKAGGKKATGGSGAELGKVTGNKSTTIHITIGNLIKEFTVKSETLKESTSKIKEIVVQTMLSAVNDSQITSGE